MKKTTVQYFCDKCKEEIKDEPNMNHVVDERFLFGGDCWVSCVDVSFMFRQYGDSIPNENILCDRCKIEALEEVLKKLKERSERNG